MMAKAVRKNTTSSTVRNGWNKENYDKIGITIPKGMRSLVKDFAKKQGMTVNELINMLLRDEIGILKGEWGFAIGENIYYKKAA